MSSKVTLGAYAELWRPQFHFTAQQGWLNDPNGLVWYDGEYHLFFQHNPLATTHSNMTWGHAVSPDLVHWQQLPNALEPDALGTIYSGSAVVDWNNTAGFGTEALIALYTAAGETVQPPAPTTQCLAFSTDRGRTWTKYDGNPIIPQILKGNRDPKVFWHTPTERWVMVLYVDDKTGPVRRQCFRFFTSPDLKRWTERSEFEGFHECPELIEFSVGGESHWVLCGADPRYVIGTFDGERFQMTSGKHTFDWGANYYAAQAYNDIPARDGRRILIGWMRGGEYPGMPFNQQMSFPSELSLRRFPEGLRLCRQPVPEIESLYAGSHERTDFTGELFDIEAEIEPGNASEFGLEIRSAKKNHQLIYLPAEQELFFMNCSARVPLVQGRLKLRVLVDRTSVEVFANDGRVTLSKCFLPKPDGKRLYFYSSGGAARLRAWQVRELRSAW